MTKTTQADSTLSLNLSNDIIEGMVKSHVTAAIAAHLASSGIDIAGKIVQETLSVRVYDNKIVRKGDYGYDRAPNWFDHEVQTAIRQMAKDCLQDWLTKQKPAIEAAFSTAYDKRRPQILKAMSDGTMKALERNWNFTFNVDLSRADD